MMNNKYTVTIRIDEEQEEVIKALFAHNNWDFEKIGMIIQKPHKSDWFGSRDSRREGHTDHDGMSDADLVAAQPTDGPRILMCHLLGTIHGRWSSGRCLAVERKGSLSFGIDAHIEASGSKKPLPCWRLAWASPVVEWWGSPGPFRLCGNCSSEYLQDSRLILGTALSAELSSVPTWKLMEIGGGSMKFSTSICVSTDTARLSCLKILWSYRTWRLSLSAVLHSAGQRIQLNMISGTQDDSIKRWRRIYTKTHLYKNSYYLHVGGLFIYSG